MRDPADFTHDAIFGVVVFAIAATLGVVLLLRMPANRRGQLRWPIFLLLGFLVFGIPLLLMPANHALRPVLEGVVFWCLLSALGLLLLLCLDGLILERMGRPLPTIALDLLKLGILGVALLWELARAGVDPAALFTGSAVISAVLGFALRDTLGNLIAGLTFQFQPPFQVGDWIAYDQNPENIGRVTEINWRATKLVTKERVEIVLPNGPLAQTPIHNFTRPTPLVRLSILVKAPLDVPPERVRRLILEVVKTVPGVSSTPSPQILTRDFIDCSIEYSVRFYTEDYGNRPTIESNVRDRIWYLFAREGITINPPLLSAVSLTHTQAPVVDDQAIKSRRCNKLAEVPIFTALSETALARLAASAKEQIFTDGEVIIRQGDQGDSLYLIEQGEVVVSALDAAKQPVEVTRLQEGSFFGEMSLLTGSTRTASVTAVKDCQLLRVDAGGLGPLLRESPELAERISQILLERQADLRLKLETGSGKTDLDPKRSVLRRICEYFAVKPRL